MLFAPQGHTDFMFRHDLEEGKGELRGSAVYRTEGKPRVQPSQCKVGASQHRMKVGKGQQGGGSRNPQLPALQHWAAALQLAWTSRVCEVAATAQDRLVAVPAQAVDSAVQQP